MAMAKAEVKTGDKLYYEDGMEMVDFESKELNKVFEKILFVDIASKRPINNRDKKDAAISHTKSNMQRMLDSI
ncbi:MAG: hypothetical protein QNK33_08600, partial [Bacteroidales bacterium]|nr:hypothetical protein [Bacteroidales bacterium]